MNETCSNSGEKQFRFSHRLIDAIPPHNSGSASAMAEYSDTDVVGLKLAVSKSGRKFFWLRYRFRNRRKVIKLGEYPSLPLVEARQLAHEHKNLLSKGLDPADERNKRQKVPTLSEFGLREYLPYAKMHKRSWDDDEAKLRRDIGEMLGHVLLTDITPRDVMQLHAAIHKKASASSANRHLALLSRMFNLAIQWGHLEKNPVRGIKKYKEAGPRLRTLSGDELTRFLQALDREENKVAAEAIRLCLLTGLRSRSEIFSLPWSEVDLEAGTVRLLHTKNGRVRTVALNSSALEVLKKLHASAKPGFPWVFPARSGDGHLIDIRKPLNRTAERAGIKDLRPHDLRRSFGSLAVNAGVDIYQVRDLLGHSSVAVTQKVYAHLLQDTLRSASEVVGKALESAMGAAA